MPLLRRDLPCLEATTAMGQALAAVLTGGDALTLEGELGTGKTTLVRAIAQAMGVEPGLISSPTYVMINQYPLQAGGNPAEIVHVDAYRIGSGDDLDALGWDRFVEAATNRVRAGRVMLIEWPGRIAGRLPTPRAGAVLTATGSDARRLELDVPDAWSDRPAVKLLLEREPVPCPITGRWVSPTSPTYPFASEQARMADLGRWFSGRYEISRPVREEDLTDGPAS